MGALPVREVRKGRTGEVGGSFVFVVVWVVVVEERMRMRRGEGMCVGDIIVGRRIEKSR